MRLAFEWVDSEDNPPQCGWPLLTKFSLVKTMSFPVIMYECESWTIKKTEYQRIDVFNCSVGEDSRESLGVQGDQTTQS